jgi:hypothetical protein
VVADEPDAAIDGLTDASYAGRPGKEVDVIQHEIN